MGAVSKVITELISAGKSNQLVQRLLSKGKVSEAGRVAKKAKGEDRMKGVNLIKSHKKKKGEPGSYTGKIEYIKDHGAKNIKEGKTKTPSQLLSKQKLITKVDSLPTDRSSRPSGSLLAQDARRESMADELKGFEKKYIPDDSTKKNIESLDRSQVENPDRYTARPAYQKHQQDIIRASNAKKAASLLKKKGK